MINQYSTKGSGDDTTKETLFYATGGWNNQLSASKIDDKGELLWGWDATESHPSFVSTTTLTADDP